MADNPDVDKAVDRVKQIVAALPWWGWAVAGGGVLGGVAYYRKHAASATSASPSTAGTQPEYQPPDGLSMSDLAGMPYDYYDWSAALTPGGQPLPTSTAPDPTATSDPTAPTQGYLPVPTTFMRPVPTPTAPTSPALPVPTTFMRPVPTPTAPAPVGHPAPAPTAPAVRYQAVGEWPAWDSPLSGIAQHYGMSWQQLYNFGNDRQIIDSAAHAHGHYSQEYNWLFPGEELQVPAR